MKKFSPNTLRFFVRHVAGAKRRQNEREYKISSLESDISMLKRSALAPKPSKKKLETGFDDLNRKVKDVINEERVLVANQQKETSLIEEMQERINLLEEKMQGMDHVHSMAVNNHLERIDEMSNRIQDLMSGVRNRQPAEYNPKRIMTQLEDAEKRKLEKIRKLEAMIRQVEKRHAQLKKNKIPKKHLDILKQTIDSHKKRLAQIKVSSI